MMVLVLAKLGQQDPLEWTQTLVFNRLIKATIKKGRQRIKSEKARHISRVLS